MEIRPYHLSDIDEIESRDCDVMISDTTTLGTVGWSFMLNGEVVAIIGIIQISHGVANLWAVVSDKARGHGLELTKKTITVLDNCFKDRNLHRVQALISPELEENARWVKSVGLQYESTLEAVTDNKEDLDMYVQVRYD